MRSAVNCLRSRLAVGRAGADGPAGLEVVGRRHDRESVDRAPRGEVVERVVRCAGRAAAQAGTAADHGHGMLGATEIVLDRRQ